MKKHFEFGAGGVIGDVGLALEQKEALKLHIGERIPESDKRRFLDAASIAVDRANKSQIYHGNDAKSVKQLENFSKAAHAMVSAIDGLRATDYGKDQDPFQYLGIYFDECLYITDPAIKPPVKWRRYKPKLEDILDQLQEDLKHLESVADYTASKIPVSRGSRPGVRKSKEVAQEVIGAYQETFGCLPAITRGSWFANFMAELGKVLELDIGDRVLSDAKKSIS
jgi:hypothetical protein